MAAARETRSALLDEQRARLRSENRARLERTARRELLEERQMVPASATQQPTLTPVHEPAPEPAPEPEPDSSPYNNQVRQLLERPEAEEVAAAMCLEFGESPLAPPSPAGTDAERSVTMARSSSGGWQRVSVA